MSKRIHHSSKVGGYRLINITPASVGQNKRNVLTSNIASCKPPVKEVSPGGFAVCKDGILNKLRVNTALYANNIFHQNDYPILPPGLIMQYSGDTSTPPGGWLLCDGSAVLKTQYPCLYEAIKNTSYGTPPSSDYFILPDLRGRVAVGTGQGLGLSNRLLAEDGGEEDHTLVITEMPTHTHAITIDAVPSHTHGITDPGHSHSYFNQANTANPAVSLTTMDVADNNNVGQTTGSSTTQISINAAGGHTHTATIHTEGGSQPHNNMQPYLVLNYIIKY